MRYDQNNVLIAMNLINQIANSVLNVGWYLHMMHITETLELEQQQKNKLDVIEERFNHMQSQLQNLIMALGTLKDQNQINQTAQMLYKSGILNIPQKT